MNATHHPALDKAYSIILESISNLNLQVQSSGFRFGVCSRILDSGMPWNPGFTG